MNKKQLMSTLFLGGVLILLHGNLKTLTADSDTVAAVSEYNDQFGHALARGDFNDDGFMDLAVGSPFEDVDAVDSAGAVFLYRGTSNGLELWSVFANAFGSLGANEPYDRFGWALAAGDYNGDEIDDLAVSAPWEAVSSNPNQSGAVFVYHGSNGGLVPAATYHQENIGISAANEGSDRFGAALTAGDFNGDGRDDLAIGAPGERPAAAEGGAVFVLAGSAAAMTAMGPVLTAQDLVAANPHEQFGSALASGNFLDTDSVLPDYDDLLIGCYNCRIGGERSGAVFLYEGQAIGLQPRMRLNQWTWDEEMDSFGRALAVADFDDGGWDDIAVGAPGENGATGYAFLWRSAGRSLQPWHALTQSGYALSEHKDRFASTLLAQDVTDSTVVDLLVGVPREAPGADPRSGVVDLYRGSASQGLGQASWFDQGYLDNNGEDDYFGKALAAADFDNDGCIEIAVGAPGKEVQGIPRAGAVYVFDCSPSGPVGWLRVTQENITSVSRLYLPFLGAP